MSHVTKIGLKIRDLDALAEACAAVGMELQRDKKTYAWWGRFMNDSSAYGEYDPQTFGRGEHAIKVVGTDPKDGSNGPWEIGVVKAKDGDGFELLADTFGSAGRALLDKAGTNFNKLRQEYAAAIAVHAARRKLGRKGFSVKRVALPNGRIRIDAVKR